MRRALITLAALAACASLLAGCGSGTDEAAIGYPVDMFESLKQEIADDLDALVAAAEEADTHDEVTQCVDDLPDLRWQYDSVRGEIDRLNAEQTRAMSYVNARMDDVGDALDAFERYCTGGSS